MPELAEVEFFRKRWDLAAAGEKIIDVLLHERARTYRGVNVKQLKQALAGATLLSSATAAKQMMFRFSRDAWLGIHLRMSGYLTVEPEEFEPRRHDHLILRTKCRSLVFSDPRMFGRVQFHRGKNPPTWWTSIAPAILSPQFT